MKQYCRYCAFCVEHDNYICTAGDIPHSLTESKIRHSNDCECFADCGIDIITGKEHTERHTNAMIESIMGEQMKIEVSE